MRTGCRAVARHGEGGPGAKTAIGGGTVYIYILQSEDGEHFYTGLTDDLRQRLEKHNAGDVPHTSKFRPWRLNTYVAFSQASRAVAFEKYLKSGSGRAFASKHF